jgi:hypothetical protein
MKSLEGTRTNRIVAALALAASACAGDQDREDVGCIGLCDDGSPETDGIHPLEGRDVNQPIGDLAPLMDLLGDTDAVAVGESYHTSGGFQRMGGRLARFLIEEMGHRAVLLETPWGPALAASDYLRSCAQGAPAGSTHESVMSFTFVWRSEEMEEFLGWACNFNEAHHDDPVELYGIEMWQPWWDLIALNTVLDTAAPEAKAELVAGIATCNGIGDPVPTADEYYFTQWLQPSTLAEFDACIVGLDAIDTFFAASRARVVAATS